MQKQYVLIEQVEGEKEVKYTFNNKKQLKEFINIMDHFNFTVKEEWIGISI